jgi:protein tyrosine phosphatase (PTP) superfamily phosphohydrolase (DUF442 family)
VPTPLDALAGVKNAAQPLPNLLSGGQPGRAQFEALRDAGVEVVLDIRDPTEPRPFDEPDLVRSLGMQYVNVPVTEDTLSDETLERLLELIRENAARPALLHCASGNRVWGPIITYLVLDQGLGEEEATNIALRGGLRGAEILEWGLDYARRKRLTEDQ